MSISLIDYEKGDYFYNKYECISGKTDRVIGLSFFNGLVRKLKQEPSHKLMRRTQYSINGKALFQEYSLEEAEEDRRRWIREHNFTRDDLAYFEYLFGVDNCKIAKF